MSYSFRKCNYIGSFGEDIFLEYYEDHPHYTKILDVSKDSHYQNLDIDFIMINVFDEEETWEVKTDTRAHQTGNLCFETIGDNIRGDVGCFLKSKADFWFYYLKGINEALIFNHNKAVKWFEERKNTFREISVRNQKGYKSISSLIPIAEFEKQSWVNRISL